MIMMMRSIFCVKSSLIFSIAQSYNVPNHCECAKVMPIGGKVTFEGFLGEILFHWYLSIHLLISVYAYDLELDNLGKFTRLDYSWTNIRICLFDAHCVSITIPKFFVGLVLKIQANGIWDEKWIIYHSSSR